MLPLDAREIGGTIIIFFLALLSNAAGIGGSTIMIALLLLIFNFETHNAIPLAQAIIWGGCLVATLLRVPKRHPRKDRPLISWELIMHLTAPLLLGAGVGVILNVIFPPWLILALLTIFIGYLSTGVLIRGIRLYIKETKIKRLESHPVIHHETTDTEIFFNDEEAFIEGLKNLPEIRNENHDNKEESKNNEGKIEVLVPEPKINSELEKSIKQEKQLIT